MSCVVSSVKVIKLKNFLISTARFTTLVRYQCCLIHVSAIPIEFVHIKRWNYYGLAAVPTVYFWSALKIYSVANFCIVTTFILKVTLVDCRLVEPNAGVQVPSSYRGILVLCHDFIP